MYKKLLIASAIVGLVGCGSSGSDSVDAGGDVPISNVSDPVDTGGDDPISNVSDPVDTGGDDPTNNVPSDGDQGTTNVDAIIAGTGSAKIYNDESSVNESLTITDVAGEDAFIAQEEEPTSYGLFSITTAGAWSYEIDDSLEAVGDLDSGKTLTDSITVVSIDGTEKIILITIASSDDKPDEEEDPEDGGEGGGEDGGGTPVEEDNTPIVSGDDNVPTVNCTQTFDSISGLKSAVHADKNNIAPGTTFCLEDGTYDNDFQMEIGGAGTEAEPIVIAAENPGFVTIEGSEVYIQMTGTYVTLQGFIFRDGTIDYNLIKTRVGDEPCNYCRITEVSVIDMDDGLNNDEDTKKWIEIYGHHNRVDHNWFSGKTSRGALLIVDRNWDEDLGDFTDVGFEKDYALIDYNYFGNRPPIEGRAYAESDDNEYEGIRIGLSDSHSGDSFSIVEHNFFERIQGEPEVISNKASNNTIRHNTVRESRGAIVSRHGHNATISNNYVISDDYPFAGGIRVVDSNHTITNNYIEGARYENSNWNGGIVVSSGDGSTSNGYQDVENVLIANNTIVDSVNSLNVAGGKYSHHPENIYFVNNIIADALGPIVRSASDMTSTFNFAGNYVSGQEFSDDASVTSISGMDDLTTPLVVGSDGLYRPASNDSLTAESSPAIGDFELPTVDMDGQTRSDTTTSGADEVSATSSDATYAILTSDAVGPLNYRPAEGKTYIETIEIENHDFDSGDLTGWVSNGAVITTDADELFSRGASVMLSSTSTISQSVDVEADTDFTLSAFAKGTSKLSVTVGGETYFVDNQESDYKFTSIRFQSGSGTSALITASVDDNHDVEAIIDDETDWTRSSVGYVGSTSDSESSGDAIKLGYKLPAHDASEPSISQTVTVEADKIYNFSLAILVKEEDSESTATVNIVANDGTVLVNDVIDYSELNAFSGLGNSYRPYRVSGLDVGSNSSVTVTVTFNSAAIEDIDDVEEDDGVMYLSDDTQALHLIYVDNLSLSYEEANDATVEAAFDSFRLIAINL